MSNVIPFKFKNTDVRVITDEQGEPWFVAKDVAELLGYSDTAKAIRTHCKGVDEMATPSGGGVQKVKIIPERDVYRLIMRSKLPAAEAFEEFGPLTFKTLRGKALPQGGFAKATTYAILNERHTPTHTISLRQ